MVQCIPQCLQPRPNFTKQAYRYGIGLAGIGVVLNWLGVAETTVGYVRYLGVLCVIIGSFLIIASMCHWMLSTPQTPPQNSIQDLTLGSDAQFGGEGLGLQHLENGDTSPPSYYQVEDKPPPYEEVVASDVPHLPLSATSFTLRSNTSSLPPYSSRFDMLAGYDRETGQMMEDKPHLTDAAVSSQNTVGPQSLDGLYVLCNKGESSETHTYSAANEILLQPRSLPLAPGRQEDIRASSSNSMTDSQEKRESNQS